MWMDPTLVLRCAAGCRPSRDAPLQVLVLLELVELEAMARCCALARTDPVAFAQWTRPAGAQASGPWGCLLGRPTKNCVVGGT